MTRKQLVLLAAFGSFALLGGAFLFQMMGYAPCKMCIWQRWPHGVAIGIGLTSLVWLPVWLPLVGALAAATTGVIGLYHTGVEKGIFEGPDTCTSNPIGDLSAQELMDQIMGAPLIRCDEVAWSLMGLSMASWNALISFILVVIWLMAWRRA